MARPTDDKKEAQAQRAAALRERIEKLAAGEADTKVPPSPREMTDKAAREQWLKENPVPGKAARAVRRPSEPG